MSAALDRLIASAYLYSKEIGRAAEAVFKGQPTKDQLDQIYAFIMQHGGEHLSFEIYMELVEAVRRNAGNRRDKR